MTATETRVYRLVGNLAGRSYLVKAKLFRAQQERGS